MRSPGPTRLRWPARLLQAAIIAGVSTLVGLGHTSLRFAMDTVDGAIPFGIGWLVNSLGWGVLIAGFVAVAELFSLVRGEPDERARGERWDTFGTCSVVAAACALALWAVLTSFA